jgi:hypothetical protein
MPSLPTSLSHSVGVTVFITGHDRVWGLHGGPTVPSQHSASAVATLQRNCLYLSVSAQLCWGLHWGMHLAAATGRAATAAGDPCATLPYSCFIRASAKRSALRVFRVCTRRVCVRACIRRSCVHMAACVHATCLHTVFMSAQGVCCVHTALVCAHCIHFMANQAESTNFVSIPCTHTHTLYIYIYIYIYR